MAPDLWAVGAPLAPETGRRTAPTIATTAAKLPIRDVLLIRLPPCVGIPDCRATLPAAFRPIAGPWCPVALLQPGYGQRRLHQAGASLGKSGGRPAPPPRGGGELGKERRRLAELLPASAGAEVGQSAGLLLEGIEQTAARLGHIGVEQQRGDAETLGQPVEHRVEPIRPGLVLRELPGLRLLDV